MNKIARLFDYQKYESNSELAGIISDVESRYPDKRRALSDDELEFVAAAGIPDQAGMKELRPKEKNKAGVVSNPIIPDKRP